MHILHRTCAAGGLAVITLHLMHALSCIYCNSQTWQQHTPAHLYKLQYLIIMPRSERQKYQLSSWAQLCLASRVRADHLYMHSIWEDRQTSKRWAIFFWEPCRACRAWAPQAWRHTAEGVHPSAVRTQTGGEQRQAHTAMDPLPKMPWLLRACAVLISSLLAVAIIVVPLYVQYCFRCTNCIHKLYIQTMCIHVYGEVLQTTYSTYTKVYMCEYPLDTYITKLLHKSVQIRAAFRNFFKGVGARLRFQEISGGGGVKPGCKIFLVV